MRTVHRMRTSKHATWLWNAGRHTLSHDQVAYKTGLLPGVSMHIIEHWHAMRCLVTFTDSKRNLSQRPHAATCAEWTPGDVRGWWCGIALILARMPLELHRARPAAVRARTVLEDRGADCANCATQKAISHHPSTFRWVFAERPWANVPPPRRWRAVTVTDGVTDGATLANTRWQIGHVYCLCVSLCSGYRLKARCATCVCLSMLDPLAVHVCEVDSMQYLCDCCAKWLILSVFVLWPSRFFLFELIQSCVCLCVCFVCVRVCVHMCLCVWEL